MKPKYRALIWEQSRTAGLICLLLGILSCLFVLTVHFLLHMGKITILDVWDFSILMFYFSMAGAALLVSRQDVRGHIVWGFDQRWFRLPVPMHVLFGIILGSRSVFLALLLGLQFLLALTLPIVKTGELALYIMIPLYLYALLQAAAWAWKRAPFLFYGPVVFLLAIMVVFRFLRVSPDEIFMIAVRALREPHTLVLAVPLAGLVMGYGVYLERHDRHFGPQNLSALTSPVSWLLSPPLGKKNSAFEAQLWYEMRRAGWVLPVLTITFTVFFTLVMLLVEEHPFSMGLAQYVPPAALVAAGLAASTKLFPRSGMQHLRPMEDCGIAAARLLAQLRGLCMAMPLAGLLSAFLLLAGPMERSILSQLLTDGFNPAFDIFIVVARPLVLAGMLAWLLLWLKTFPMGVVIVIVSVFSALSSHFLSGHYAVLHYSAGICVFVVMSLLLTLSLLLYTWLKGMISQRQFWGALCLCVVLASFIWLGSRSLAGSMGLWLSVATGTLLAAPLPSLAWLIRAERHDTGFRRYYL
ncbi:MAG TPA: hypothetical protein PLC40_06325 [Candidatus Hydrogenedentes bacterium]|nr:hypothetical protein [Candidatus Hydrogenedentota bacterium]